MKKFLMTSVAGLVLAVGMGTSAKAAEFRHDSHYRPVHSYPHHNYGYSYNYRPYVYRPYVPYTPYVYNTYTPAPYCGSGAYVGGNGFSVGVWR